MNSCQARSARSAKPKSACILVSSSSSSNGISLSRSSLAAERGLGQVLGWQDQDSARHAKRHRCGRSGITARSWAWVARTPGGRAPQGGCIAVTLVRVARWPGAADPARMRPGRRGWVAGIRSSWGGQAGMPARLELRGAGSA